MKKLQGWRRSSSAIAPTNSASPLELAANGMSAHGDRRSLPESFGSPTTLCARSTVEGSIVPPGLLGLLAGSATLCSDLAGKHPDPLAFLVPQVVASAHVEQYFFHHLLVNSTENLLPLTLVQGRDLLGEIVVPKDTLYGRDSFADIPHQRVYLTFDSDQVVIPAGGAPRPRTSRGNEYADNFATHSRQSLCERFIRAEIVPQGNFSSEMPTFDSFTRQDTHLLLNCERHQTKTVRYRGSYTQYKV